MEKQRHPTKTSKLSKTSSMTGLVLSVDTNREAFRPQINWNVLNFQTIYRTDEDIKRSIDFYQLIINYNY